MLFELAVIHFVFTFRHVKVEINHEKEFDFERIYFFAVNTSDFAVIRVIEVLVVEKLGGKHEGTNDKSVHAVAVHDEVLILVDEAVNVDETENKTLFGTPGILGNSAEIVFNGYGGWTKCMKFANVRGIHMDTVIAFAKLRKYACQYWY